MALLNTILSVGVTRTVNNVALPSSIHSIDIRFLRHWTNEITIPYILNVFAVTPT